MYRDCDRENCGKIFKIKFYKSDLFRSLPPRGPKYIVCPCFPLSRFHWPYLIKANDSGTLRTHVSCAKTLKFVTADYSSTEQPVAHGSLNTIHILSARTGVATAKKSN